MLVRPVSIVQVRVFLPPPYHNDFTIQKNVNLRPDKWGRPPNFLLVDYYNIGSVNGSVFQAAAMLNNVTYNGKCCGRLTSASSGKLFSQFSNNIWSAYLVVAMMTLMALL